MPIMQTVFSDHTSSDVKCVKVTSVDLAKINTAFDVSAHFYLLIALISMGICLVWNSLKARPHDIQSFQVNSGCSKTMALYLILFIRRRILGSSLQDVSSLLPHGP